MPQISVFTPTYNRANTLYRLFLSLQNQTRKDFEWILINDASTDETDALVERIKSEADFSIHYFKQPVNSGKHKAHNKAMELAKAELFTVVDSDDELELNAISRVLQLWASFPEAEKKTYSGFYLTCKLKKSNYYAPEVNNAINDTNDIDIVYKLKLTGDRWAVRRTDVFKEFPFPENFSGPYYPEGIIWKKIGAKYRFRIFDEPLYIINYDGEESLMRAFDGWTKDTKYVIEIALDHLNNYFKYFFDAPFLFLQQALYFTVFSFYMPNTIATWRRLQLVKWLFVIWFFLPAIFVILLKKMKGYLKK
jgi:glycosyltransferase involved in cell wall biosynthesis